MWEHSSEEVHRTSKNRGFIYQLNRGKGRERTNGPSMGRTNGPFLGKTNWLLGKQMEGMTVCDNAHFCSFSLGDSSWSSSWGWSSPRRGDLWPDPSPKVLRFGQIDKLQKAFFLHLFYLSCLQFKTIFIPTRGVEWVPTKGKWALSEDQRNARALVTSMWYFSHLKNVVIFSCVLGR